MDVRHAGSSMVLVQRAPADLDERHPEPVPRSACAGLNLTIPAGTSRPTVHGLRHSFAVGTLLRWYRAGENPAARLQHLSTFLGHVNTNATAVYLTITAELLREANDRFEAFARPLVREEVTP